MSVKVMSVCGAAFVALTATTGAAIADHPTTPITYRMIETMQERHAAFAAAALQENLFVAAAVARAEGIEHAEEFASLSPVVAGPTLAEILHAEEFASVATSAISTASIPTAALMMGQRQMTVDAFFNVGP